MKEMLCEKSHKGTSAYLNASPWHGYENMEQNYENPSKYTAQV
jgi:hypothetical protein